MCPIRAVSRTTSRTSDRSESSLVVLFADQEIDNVADQEELDERKDIVQVGATEGLWWNRRRRQSEQLILSTRTVTGRLATHLFVDAP